MVDTPRESVFAHLLDGANGRVPDLGAGVVGKFQPSGANTRTRTHKTVATSVAARTTLIAPSGVLKHKIAGMIVTSSGTTKVSLYSGGSAAIAAYNMIAGVPVALNNNGVAGEHWLESAAGTTLSAAISATADVTFNLLTYAEA